MLITISGLYGSGGNELGMDLGKELGYEIYDGKLIEKAVEHSGLDMRRSTLSFYDESDAAIDEKIGDPYSNALLKLQMDVLPIGSASRSEATGRKESGLLSAFLNSAPVNQREGTLVRQKQDIDALRFAQAKLILEAADKGNGIFLGRCAGYILKNRKDSLNIFTCASIESCRKRIAELYGIEDEEKIDNLCRTTNRRRAYYYETFTDQKWDDIENYDMCINTDYLGYDGTFRLIKQLVELKSAQL